MKGPAVQCLEQLFVVTPTMVGGDGDKERGGYCKGAEEEAGEEEEQKAVGEVVIAVEEGLEEEAGREDVAEEEESEDNGEEDEECDRIELVAVLLFVMIPLSPLFFLSVSLSF